MNTFAITDFRLQSRTIMPTVTIASAGVEADYFLLDSAYGHSASGLAAEERRGGAHVGLI